MEEGGTENAAYSPVDDEEGDSGCSTAETSTTNQRHKKKLPFQLSEEVLVEMPAHDEIPTPKRLHFFGHSDYPDHSTMNGRWIDNPSARDYFVSLLTCMYALLLTIFSLSIEVSSRIQNNDKKLTDCWLIEAVLRISPWVPFQHGTYVIGYFSAFLIIANFSLKAAGYSDIAWNWELLFLVVDSVAVASLIYGVYAERAAFLQPFVVLSVRKPIKLTSTAQIVTLMFFVLLSCFFCSAIILQEKSYAAEYIEVELGERAQHYAQVLSVTPKKVVPTVAAIAVVLTSAVVILHFWFIRVVVQCALYFRDLEPIKCLQQGYKAEELAEVSSPSLASSPSSPAAISNESVSSDTKDPNEDS